MNKLNYTYVMKHAPKRAETVPTNRVVKEMLQRRQRARRLMELLKMG